MPPKPTITETCPQCGATFVGTAIKVAGRSPFKRCPKGHETALYKLLASRGPQPTPSPLAQLRELGITGEREGFKAMTAALVGCYEQLLRTTPPCGHGVVDGVFGSYIKLARRMLGVA